jgi:hypothetical protein
MAEARRGTRARRTPKPPQGAAGPGATRAGGAEDAAPTDGAAPPPLCAIAFCPICTFVTAVGEVRPEMVDHLIVASREVLLAARALIDARLEGMPPPPKMERLTIG